MADLITALARLRAFRSNWNDDDQIDVKSQPTAADLDTILAAAHALDDDEVTRPFNGGGLDGLI